MVGQDVCGRISYGLAVGILGIIFSLISILATMVGRMNRMVEVGSSGLIAIFYFFGVGTFFLFFYF